MSSKLKTNSKKSTTPTATSSSSVKLSSALRASVPKLDSNELLSVSKPFKARNVANTALRNNSQKFMESFLKHSMVEEAIQSILEYNTKESLALSFEFFIIKIGDEYFYLAIDDKGPYIISINSKKAESKFKVILRKLNSLFKTASFKICSSVISKTYIQECLQTSEFFFIALGMHKRHTKLKNELSKESPNKKLESIASYDCLGFAFLERYKKSKDSIYLQAICSNKGFGDRILRLTELLSEYLLFNKMYLSSVDTALSYYLSRGYEVIINRRNGRNLKYIVDPSTRRGIKTPIPGSKELYGYQGSLMFRSERKSKTQKTNNSTTSRRSTRTRKRVNNTSVPKQYILQNVSFDSDNNINMVKELTNLR